MDSARLLMVCGSWQPTSANSAIVRRAAARAERAGVAVDHFGHLRGVPPFDPMRVDDAPPSVVALRDAVEAADAVLIAAPEYAGALAGVVKNSLDWLVGAGSMWDRTVGVACAGTTGGFFARRDLAQTLAWQGALVVAHLGVAAPGTKSDPLGDFTDPATLEQIDGFVDELLHLAGEPRAVLVGAARAVAADLGVDPARVAADQDG